MNKILETERLFIEPLSKTDSKFILELLNTQGWIKFIGDRNVHNEIDAGNYIQRILDNHNCAYSVFKLKENKTPLGIITFIKRDNQQFPDIGFAMLPGYEKNGFAYEAARKYMDEIVKNGQHKNIIGITVSDNWKSISLLEKLGLRFKEKYFEKNDELSVYSVTLE